MSEEGGERGGQNRWWRMVEEEGLRQCKRIEDKRGVKEHRETIRRPCINMKDMRLLWHNLHLLSRTASSRRHGVHRAHDEKQAIGHSATTTRDKWLQRT
jgi:hypothetical protein